MSKLTKVTNTSLNIGKILDVLENTKAECKDIIKITGLIKSMIPTIRRWTDYKVKNMDNEIDFCAGDIQNLADCADIHIRRFTPSINHKVMFNNLTKHDVIDNTAVNEWATTISDKIYVVALLREFSSVMHFFATLLAVVEDTEDDFNSAAILAIKEYLRKN